TEESATDDEKVRFRTLARHLRRRLDEHMDALPALEARHHDNQRGSVGNTEFGAELFSARREQWWDKPVANDSDYTTGVPRLAKAIRHELGARNGASRGQRHGQGTHHT